MEIRLIRVKKDFHHHVSMSDVSDFEESMLQAADMQVFEESVFLRKFIKLPVARILNFLLPKIQSPVFCISMGVSGVNRSFPYMFLSSQNYLYLFDAWPGTYKLIARTVDAYNIKALFVSSKESAINLRNLLPKTKVVWCPEGCKFENYKAFDYSLKDIDIIQLGRKYDLWHNRVVDELNRQNIKYIYQKVQGKVIFPHREDFINGLARSKISVCFPKSITHCAESGGISTMTHRYLQSMASKCLIVGSAPEEMKDFFDYDPVIPVDKNDPAGQLVDILRNYKDYLHLIEKNYQECRLNHSWNNRCKLIIDIIGGKQ